MIVIKTPKTKEDFKEYYALRYRVLREPYGHPKGTEKDDYEPISQHFMAVDDQSGEVVGVVKFYEKESGVCQFSHLAILETYQEQGIGNLLVEHIENIARKDGYKILGAMSRLNTTKFFEKLGFEITGMPAHYIGTTLVIWMEKKL
jgi:N-acetylglutamate synthase-like GNAT family acetyltransferase